MRWYEYKEVIFLNIVLISIILGLIHIKRMDKAIRILVLYLVITFISETSAIYCAFAFRNNLPIYHIYGLIQYSLLCSYYIYAIPIQNKWHVFILYTLGISLGITNSVLIQNPLKEFNSNFIAYISFTIILLSLFSFYRLLESTEIDILRMPHFWITTLLLIFWSFTFFYWVIGTKLNDATIKGRQWLDVIFMSINYLAYSGFAVVFWQYPKMKKA